MNKHVRLLHSLYHEHKKLLRVTRNTILLLLIGTSQIFAGNNYSNNTSLDFPLDEVVMSVLDVTGKVIDDIGESMPGVTIMIKGTNQGTITDVDGNYSLSDVPSDATLVFSFIGMKTIEIPVDNRSVIDVSMVFDAISLDAIVKIGYTSVKKRDLSGSISSISSKDLTQSGAPNVAQAIQGKTAGVYISRKNGKPGEGVSVRIRGMGGISNSEPLYVVDGIYGGSLDVNPSDIESIEILKDASSAAIYGARGANGVVIITTKRGKAGGMKVQVNSSVGFQNIINSGKVKMLNAQEYGEVQNTMYRNDGFPEPFGGELGLPEDLFPAPSALGEGTDWLNTMFKSNAPIYDHSISFSGGTEKHLASLSMTYQDQDGLYLDSGFEKYNFRVNTDHHINDWFSIGSSTSFGHSKTIGRSGTDNRYGDFWFMLLAEPTIPTYNEDGTFAGPPHPFYGPQRTPFAKNASSNDVEKSHGLSNNFFAEFKPLDFLTFKTSLINNYSTTEFTGHENGIFKEGIVAGETVNVSSRNGNSTGWTWNNILAYNQSFGNHNFKALTGYEMSKGKWNGVNGTSKYLDPSFLTVESGAAESSTLNQYRGEESMISYIGSVSYNYKGKYYVTGNVRRDGSSRFGKNNRFGTFPSASVAWRVSDEKFFPKNIFTDFKIRASYGQVGNDKIGSYQYVSSLANVFYSFTGEDGSFESGMVTQGLANSDLKWETSTQKNIGVDMLFMDGKFRVVADYFTTDVSDMLLGKTIPTTSGIGSLDWGRYSSVTTNAGSLTNSGLEFEVGYREDIGDFTYGVNANITTYTNIVTDLGENEYLTGVVEGDVRNRTYVDGSIGDFYGYVCDGIFQTQAELDAANALNEESPYQSNETIPGDFKFRDLNGDGTITDEDRQVIGSPIPDFTYGFGLNLAYKRVSFNALFYGSQGNDIYNSLRGELEQQGRSQNKSTSVLNAWNGEGTSNTIPIRRIQDLNTNLRTSTTFLEDGSFLRLQNIMLAYELPVNFAKMRIYVSGDNLLTFTKYSGFNPEVTISKEGGAGNRLDSGVDSGYYPNASIYRFGVNVAF